MWLKIILNLLAMLAIALVLGWLAFTWMDVWTLHGKYRTVPDLKGLDYNQAVERLADDGLTIELSDSVYDSKARPGAVIDQNPRPGNKVKPGRVVYVTIKAFSPRTVTVPQITDISLRQAVAILKGLKIENIDTVRVISDFRDLVLGATYNGRPLKQGARIPVDARITLEVGDGLPNLPDSVMVDDVNTGAAADVELLNL